MLIYLSVFVCCLTIYCLVKTRKICYFSPKVTTDNEKMILAANEISLSSWPSRMHDIPYNRSQLREFWTILLALISRYILREKSDYGNVVLALLSHVVSTGLLFWLSSLYLSDTHAFLIAIFYASLLWPYYISIYAGHILLAQAFFLGSLICLSNGILGDQKLWIFFAGILAAVSFFSSSASRKYPIIFLVVAFLLLARENGYNTPNNLLFIVIGFSSCMTSLLLAFLGRKFLTKWVLTVFKIKNQRLDLIFSLVTKVLFSVPLFVGVGLFGIFFMPSFLTQMVIILTGIFIVIISILMPFQTFLINVKRYGTWLHVSDWASHFNSYPDPLKTFGHEIPVHFKGGGWNWLNLLFCRFIPELYLLWTIACLFLIFGPAFGIVNVLIEPFEILAVIVISLLPSIIHYATGGLRVGKAMFSVVLPMFLPISIVINASSYFELIVITFLIFQLCRTIYLLHTHIIPCRMAPTILRDKLRYLGVEKFYTYKTHFNDSLVETMIYGFPDEFEVVYVKNMSEVKEGYLVVPQTSAKSVSMETQQEAINNGDFTYDSNLDSMIISREIESIAIARIPTLGNSKYFAQESEVTSYLDLILKKISKLDFYRGNAWILDIK